LLRGIRRVAGAEWPAHAFAERKPVALDDEVAQVGRRDAPHRRRAQALAAAIVLERQLVERDRPALVEIWAPADEPACAFVQLRREARAVFVVAEILGVKTVKAVPAAHQEHAISEVDARL
jgi:hypothetical protein